MPERVSAAKKGRRHLTIAVNRSARADEAGQGGSRRIRRWESWATDR
jgi:hypothetical protein